MAAQQNPGGGIVAVNPQPGAGVIVPGQILFDPNAAFGEAKGVAYGGGGVTQPYAGWSTKFGGAGLTNQMIQFAIANAAGANKYLRIGSHVGIENGYTGWSALAAGAAETNGITDDNGAKVLKIQGFSRLTTSKAFLVSEIKLSSSDTTQLTSEVKHCHLNIDGTVTERVINVLSTQQVSDDRTDLIVLNCFQQGMEPWLLDAMTYLQFTSVNAKSITIILNIFAAAEVALFTKP